MPNKTLRRKMARQAARAVLPNATETKIVVTANARSWRHFIEMRASAHAEPEIRRLAITILRVLQQEAPNLFGDYEIVMVEDGSEAGGNGPHQRCKPTPIILTGTGRFEPACPPGVGAGFRPACRP